MRQTASVSDRVIRALLFWPAVALLRAADFLAAHSTGRIARVTLRPALRFFCLCSLYARPLRLFRDKTQQLVTTRDLESIFRGEKWIATIPCACRGLAGNCAHPEHSLHESDTCISLGVAAVLQAGSGLGKRITADEAIALCRRGADSGLVHHGIYSFGRMIELCNCCSESCTAIRAYKHGIPEAIRPTPLMATRSGACNGCAGRSARMCLTICPYGKSPSDGGCLGCGLCASRCPRGAITMAQRFAR